MNKYRASLKDYPGNPEVIGYYVKIEEVHYLIEVDACFRDVGDHYYYESCMSADEFREIDVTTLKKID